MQVVILPCRYIKKLHSPRITAAMQLSLFNSLDGGCFFTHNQAVFIQTTSSFDSSKNSSNFSISLSVSS